MTLYFIDGRVDCFETSIDYPELENAYNIDAVDGITSCFDQLNELEAENDYDNLTIISNFISFLDQADIVYLYDKKTKVFKLWDYKDFPFPQKDSKVHTYIFNLYARD